MTSKSWAKRLAFATLAALLTVQIGSRAQSLSDSYHVNATASAGVKCAEVRNESDTEAFSTSRPGSFATATVLSSVPGASVSGTSTMNRGTGSFSASFDGLIDCKSNAAPASSINLYGNTQESIRVTKAGGGSVTLRIAIEAEISSSLREGTQPEKHDTLYAYSNVAVVGAAMVDDFTGDVAPSGGAVWASTHSGKKSGSFRVTIPSGRQARIYYSGFSGGSVRHMSSSFSGSASGSFHLEGLTPGASCISGSGSLPGCDFPFEPVDIDGKLLGSPCEQVMPCAAGNPIEVTGGNKFQAIADYQSAGPNVLEFTRYYNGLAINGSPPLSRGLGTSWRSTFDRSIRISTPTTVSVERPSGRILQFAFNGIWRPDTDIDLQLTRSGNIWTLKDSTDTVETYETGSPSHAILREIRFRNGYTQSLIYDASGLLSSVVDSFDRSLLFTYDDGRLATLTTPEGTVTSYSFEPSQAGGALDRLRSATDGAGGTETYLYEQGALPFALTGILNPKGNRSATWTYDAAGRALSSKHGVDADTTTVRYNADGTRTVTNALGLQEVYRFAELQGIPKVKRIDRLATATTAAASQAFTYDANGYLASETDWNGNETRYVNDARGLRLTVTEAAGTPQARTTTTTYHPGLHLPVKIVRPGVTTDFVYDVDGNLLTRTESDTSTGTKPSASQGTLRKWTYTWSRGLLAATTGPRTNVIDLFEHDASGALTSVTNARGHVTSVTSHTAGGRPLTIVDPNGVATELLYDGRQRLISSTVHAEGGALTTGYVHDLTGNLVTVTKPDGSALTYTYDAANRLTAVTDLFGQRMVYRLDALGNRTRLEVFDADGEVARTGSATFDALGRVTGETGGEGQVTRYTYDRNGNLLKITNPLSRETSQAFDALNRRIRVTDPADGVTQTQYDAHDRILSVSDPNGAVTLYSYDGFGRRTKTVSPDTGTTLYKYDVADNLIQKTDARGAVTTYTYDALDRMLSVKFPGVSGQNITYQYDQAAGVFGVGRLTTVKDPAGTLTRVYDARGNVASELRKYGKAKLTTAYAHDEANRIVSLTYPSGGRADYARDAMGRVTGLTFKPKGVAAPLSVVSAIGYKPFGPENSLTFGNGILETRLFDDDGRLTSLAATGLAPVQNLTYGYDAADNVRSIADSVDVASSQSFGYDTLDRLTSASGAYGARGWTYDPVGNRKRQTANGVLTTYDYALASNRLMEVRTGAARQALGYTADGNISRSENIGTASPVLSMVYNQGGRLVQALSGATLTMQNSYDGFGQRLVRQGVATGATLFQYDLDGHLLEDADGLGKGRVDYVYLGDRPIATFQLGLNKLTFLHIDRLGTPQRATDATQTVVWKATVEPFGAAHVSVGLTSQNLRLPGQEFEADTGRHHNGFRDYVPAWGRYLQSDPIGLAGGVNSFAYALANPVKLVDPTGTNPVLGVLGACIVGYAVYRAEAAIIDAADAVIEARYTAQGANAYFDACTAAGNCDADVLAQDQEDAYRAGARLGAAGVNLNRALNGARPPASMK
jgi:RHS repeat-associated protein